MGCSMNQAHKELQSLVWQLCRTVFGLFLIFVIGWVLTACLLGLLSSAINELPLWLRLLVFLGTPLLGGAAALFWWRHGRHAAAFRAFENSKLARMPYGVKAFLVVCLGMTAIGLFP